MKREWYFRTRRWLWCEFGESVLTSQLTFTLTEGSRNDRDLAFNSWRMSPRSKVKEDVMEDVYCKSSGTCEFR
jgi:hypothetical protein